MWWALEVLSALILNLGIHIPVKLESPGTTYLWLMLHIIFGSAHHLLDHSPVRLSQRINTEGWNGQQDLAQLDLLSSPSLNGLGPMPNVQS